MAKAKEKDSKPDAAASEEAESPAPSSRKWSIIRLVAIAGTALTLALAGAWGAYAFFLAGKKEEKVAIPAPKPPTFFDLPDVLVNLATPGTDKTQYLKVKLVLELSDPALVEQIKPVLPRVMDTFQVFLRELRSSDLEGSAGTYRLKEEMTRRVNAAIAPGRVNAVLFKEFLVQ
jgi:flagellar FliL protein